MERAHPRGNFYSGFDAFHLPQLSTNRFLRANGKLPKSHLQPSRGMHGAICSELFCVNLTYHSLTTNRKHVSKSYDIFCDVREGRMADCRSSVNWVSVECYQSTVSTEYSLGCQLSVNQDFDRVSITGWLKTLIDTRPVAFNTHEFFLFFYVNFYRYLIEENILSMGI